MRELHALNAVLVIAASGLAAGWGFVYVRRKRTPGRIYAHLLALAQALLIAQVALGLLLLSDGSSSPTASTRSTAGLALLAVLSPWVYAPPVPRAPAPLVLRGGARRTALSIRGLHHRDMNVSPTCARSGSSS